MKKTPAENAWAMLHYQDYDAVPVLDFSYWEQLVRQEWRSQGHLTQEECDMLDRGVSAEWGPVRDSISRRLGFDLLFQGFNFADSLFPPFEPRILRTFPDGGRHRLNGDGVVLYEVPGVTSIPMEIEHTLVDRASWEKEFLPRLQWDPSRLGDDLPARIAAFNNTTDQLRRLGVGSGIGRIRNILGIVGLSYMQADDPELLHEIVQTCGEISYRGTKALLEAGLRPQAALYWEDISYNHGPLVSPAFFREEVVPVYRRVTSLLREYGCDIVQVDSDGKLDELVPLFLEGGVNTMFPIEIGTWKTDFPRWRQLYGRELRGIGGMNKIVLTQDKAAIDAEIERLKPWVDLGGFIPCPDHLMPLGTKWELVQYYVDAFRKAFS